LKQDYLFKAAHTLTAIMMKSEKHLFLLVKRKRQRGAMS
jgi:hypothetical protein